MAMHNFNMKGIFVPRKIASEKVVINFGALQLKL